MNNINNKTKEEKKKYNKVVVTKKQRVKTEKGITILALVITVLFSYDEKLKCSNSKGFLLQTI